MNPLLNIAVKAARQAGTVIMRGYEQLDNIKISEKSRNDFVTDVDLAAEKAIIESIRKVYPEHGICAEESGISEGDEYTWVIDPLDGTCNFIHGLPQFAVSIAVMHKNRVEHGVVYDPFKQELFTASRGSGAQLDNKRIRVSKQEKLEQSLISTGFPFRFRDTLPSYYQMFQSVYERLSDVRRTGSAALDLAYVACGRLEGHWEFGLHAWDIAAGALLITEAGGLVSDFQGSEQHIKKGEVVAATPKVFRELLPLIRAGHIQAD